MDTKAYKKADIFPSAINNQEILARFNTIINEVLIQFDTLGVYNIISNLKKLIINQEKLSEITDALINEITYSKGKCNYANFNGYIKALLDEFTINEQCIIVAHFNLSEERYLLEDIEFLLYEFLYQTVQLKLTQN